MHHDERRRRFEELIASTGAPLASLTPRMGLELILRFCAEAQAKHILLYSWGNVAVYGTEEELGFSYHFIDVDPEGRGWELKFRFGPRERVGDQESGGLVWGCFPEDLETFLAKVEEASPVFRILGDSQAAAVALIDDHDPFPLFDCWGVRDPSRPIVSMTEKEWLASNDAPLMLRWFRQRWRGEEADLDRLLHRYCLACCRQIWRLFPHEASRTGVEVAERFIDGLATIDELSRAEYEAEGGAYTFEYELDAEVVARWTEEASRIPREEFDALIHSPRPEDDLTSNALLKHAAYFADIAICYPGIRPKESIERYRLFLSAPLLREVVGNPFRAEPNQAP
jgi:hypothetical protein